MSTTYKNLFINQGSYFVHSLTAVDEYGNQLQITAGSGYTASGQLRRSYDSSSKVDFTSQITGATGTIYITLGPTNSAALKYGNYVYDVELNFPDGKIVRQLQGIATVDPEVTR